MRNASLLRRLKTILKRSVPTSQPRNSSSFPEQVEREQLLPNGATNSPRRRPRKHGSAGKTLSWLPRVLTFNFYTVHLAYIFSLCVLGGIFIYVFEMYEAQPLTWVDAMFTATSAACVTGLSSQDFSRLTLATKLISALLTTLGSHTVMALVPILVRRHIYRKTQGRGIGRSRRRVDEMTLQFEGRVVNEAEYDALGLLQWIIVIYIIGIQTISFSIMAIYAIANSSVWKTISFATPNKHSPITVLLFHSIFAFHNAGLSLLEDSLVPIANNRLLILTHAFLITCGNVLFPVFLRISVWIGRHWWDRGGSRKVAFRYLLRNPRRCSTHLFPSVQTRVLGWIWLMTNSAEYVAFLALDFSGIALAGRPASDRYLDGFFQSISTRTAGYNIAEISLFSPAMHVLWVMLMYLSSYPFVLTMRQTATTTAPPPTFTPLPSPAATRGFGGLRTSQSHRGSINGSPMYPRLLTPTAFYLPDANDHGSHRFAEPTVEMWSSEDEVGDSGEESDGSYQASPLIDGGIKSLLVPPSPTARAASELAGTFKGLMLRDATWLYTALFMICALEGERIRGNADGELTVFAVAFEVVSGYGTVGLSMGPPGKTISLSALLSPASKLIVTVIMLMGRHRGLPDSLDAAVPEIDLTRPRSGISTPGRITPNGGGSPVVWQASQTLLPRNVRSIRSETTGKRGRPALVAIDFPSSPSNDISPSDNQVASASRNIEACILHSQGRRSLQICTSDRTEGGGDVIPIPGNSSVLKHSTDTRNEISKTFSAGRLHNATVMADEDDEDLRHAPSSSWTPGTLLMYHQQQQKQQSITRSSAAIQYPRVERSMVGRESSRATKLSNSEYPVCS